MGVVGGHGQQEVGVASGWNLWVWLECIGVVSGCCCKEVYRYPHNNYLLFPTPHVLALFLAAASLLLCSIFTCFLFLSVFLVQYGKHCSMNIQDRLKIEITGI